jgi:hypothetical protein
MHALIVEERDGVRIDRGSIQADIHHAATAMLWISDYDLIARSSESPDDAVPGP